MKVHGKPTEVQQNAVKIMNIAEKTHKNSLKVGKMHQGTPKTAQPAPKVSMDGPKWAHVEPLLPTLETALATCGMPLRIVRHFHEVFVNNCAFFLKIHGNTTKIKAQPASKMSPDEPK